MKTTEQFNHDFRGNSWLKDKERNFYDCLIQGYEDAKERLNNLRARCKNKRIVSPATI
ncbi:MAG: hypothetical protein K5920_06525 [Bacteroidales bacterium]|nr:hypothetical protein [Bacteroidales bacterium]